MTVNKLSIASGFEATPPPQHFASLNAAGEAEKWAWYQVTQHDVPIYVTTVLSQITSLPSGLRWEEIKIPPVKDLKRTSSPF